jgi:hypothetical protein
MSGFDGRSGEARTEFHPAGRHYASLGVLPSPWIKIDLGRVDRRGALRLNTSAVTTLPRLGGRSFADVLTIEGVVAPTGLAQQV